jgi:hypothetical protein
MTGLDLETTRRWPLLSLAAAVLFGTLILAAAVRRRKLDRALMGVSSRTPRKKLYRDET